MLAGSSSPTNLELECYARVGSCHWIRRLRFDSIAGGRWSYCNAAGESASPVYDDADADLGAAVRRHDRLGQAERKIRRGRGCNDDSGLRALDDLAGSAGNSQGIVARRSL